MLIKDAAKIFLCTGYNKIGCSENPGWWLKCYQTSGHLSGYATGNSGCNIYSNSDCTGVEDFVDKQGWSVFPFIPKSYKCLDLL